MSHTSTLVVRCGGRIVYERLPVESKWTGEIESSRRQFLDNMWKLVAVMPLTNLVTKAYAEPVKMSSADQIRKGFMQLIDVFTAITEPILWFYAITACILMATGRNKELGWSRLKNVGYAYICISLLPTFFVFLRWVAKLISSAIQM